MKQVIVVNESLRLPRGKLSAQVAHAAVGALMAADKTAQRQWLTSGMPKVVLRCDSDEQLRELERSAKEAGLPVVAIRDAGHTVVSPGTFTCIGIGPAEVRDIDAVTGQLPLVD